MKHDLVLSSNKLQTNKKRNEEWLNLSIKTDLKGISTNVCVNTDWILIQTKGKTKREIIRGI